MHNNFYFIVAFLQQNKVLGFNYSSVWEKSKMLRLSTSDVDPDWLYILINKIWWICVRRNPDSWTQMNVGLTGSGSKSVLSTVSKKFIEIDCNLPFKKACKINLMPKSNTFFRIRISGKWTFWNRLSQFPPDLYYKIFLSGPNLKVKWIWKFRF